MPENGDYMTVEGGRHFCIKCRKLIRVGERFNWRSESRPFRRGYRVRYWHLRECVNECAR